MKAFYLHMGDWQRDAGHLNDVEQAVYMRMLMAYYSREMPLPLDVERTMKLARAVTKWSRAAVPRLLEEFFIETPGGWMHKRAAKEVERYEKRKVQLAGAREVRLSTTAPKNTEESTTPQSPTEMGTTHKPVTSNHKKFKSESARARATPARKGSQEKEKFEPPLWMPAEAWQNWVDYRSSGKKPVTPAMMALWVKKLDALRGDGDEPTEVIEQSIACGWTGLFAVKRGTPASQKSAKRESFAQSVWGNDEEKSDGQERDITSESQRIA